MRWVRLLGSVFILAGGIVSARSANEVADALETCFKAARIADAICSKLPDDPAQRKLAASGSGRGARGRGARAVPTRTATAAHSLQQPALGFLS